MRRPLRAAAALVVVALAYVAFRLFVHSSALLVPAVVMRGMDVHEAVSPALGARIARLLAERFGRVPAERPKLIALTFDDGPYAVSTPLLLDVLHDLDVRATFFLIGRDAQQFPELARRIAASGHEIANHTYSHPNLDTLDVAAVRNELQAGAEALAPFARDPAIGRYMRPPHGRYTEATLRAANDAGYDVVLWNDDPGDWRSVGPAAIERHVESRATAPDIVLLHSGKDATERALPSIVAAFRRAGYRFVTVSQLLAAVPAAAVNRPLHVDLSVSADGG